MHIFDAQPWDLSGSVDSSNEEDFIKSFKEKELKTHSEKVKRMSQIISK